jgi:hypothetical protein
MVAALELGLGLLKWLAGHKTLAALVLCAGGLAWSRHELAVLTIERDAADARIAAAEQQRDLATQDAARWQGASALRDRAIADLDAAMARQSAAVEAERAARQRADRIAAAEASAARQAGEALQQRISAAEENAHAHPDQVRKLGPIARDLARQLQDE